MKTILVTGGAGYIGTHTIVELSKSGYEVIILDDFSNSNPKILNNLHKIVGKSIKIFPKDIKEQFDDIIQTNNVEGIIHFAAHKSVEESVREPQKYYDNNINTLLSVLDHCKHLNINNLIFSSSCSVYGDTKYFFDGQGKVDESTPLDPQSPYAYTKMVCERIIQDYCKANENMNAISLRYFNPVGAHDSIMIGEFSATEPSNLVPVICKYAKGKIEKLNVYGNNYPTRDGTCIRDYVHVSDIADAHVLALNHIMGDYKGYDVFNLGSENGTTVLEVIAAFERVSGFKLDYELVARREGDIAAILSDSTKARNILGWKPKYNLDQMVESAWKWENTTNI
jgi:UDP-glucose 4-epimerase